MCNQDALILVTHAIFTCKVVKTEYELGINILRLMTIQRGTKFTTIRFQLAEIGTRQKLVFHQEAIILVKHSDAICACYQDKM